MTVNGRSFPDYQVFAGLGMTQDVSGEILFIGAVPELENDEEIDEAPPPVFDKSPVDDTGRIEDIHLIGLPMGEESLEASFQPLPIRTKERIFFDVDDSVLGTARPGKGPLLALLGELLERAEGRSGVGLDGPEEVGRVRPFPGVAPVRIDEEELQGRGEVASDEVAVDMPVEKGFARAFLADQEHKVNILSLEIEDNGFPGTVVAEGNPHSSHSIIAYK